MSVQLRGKKFHYRYQVNGVKYSGVCPDCVVPDGASHREIAEIRRKAEAFARENCTKVAQNDAAMKQKEAEIRANRTVRALVENYRYELTGGEPITLDEAFGIAAQKPAKHKPSQRYVEQRRRYWEDFNSFIKATYGEINSIAQITRSHCEAYVKYLVDHGRFVKEVSFSKPHSKRLKNVLYTRNYLLAPKTIKEIAGVCKWVFSCLAEDAGLVNNPFQNVVLPAKNAVPREVFTREELLAIWDGLKDDDFCRPLFMIAANSGLTEGDICTMKWAEIDFCSGYLRTHRRKTGVKINLPLLPELIDYLKTLPRNGEYVLPEHAEMYLHNPSCVSDRVHKFLTGLGIVTTVEQEGRKAVSVKDLHSMRHVFCYRAKRAGIPEGIIQKFVGHAVLAMTQHYADHDTDEELRQEIQKLPALFIGEPGADHSEDRKLLAELAYSLPLDQVHRILQSLRNSDLKNPEKWI